MGAAQRLALECARIVQLIQRGTGRLSRRVALAGAGDRGERRHGSGDVQRVLEGAVTQVDDLELFGDPIGFLRIADALLKHTSSAGVVGGISRLGVAVAGLLDLDQQAAGIIGVGRHQGAAGRGLEIAVGVVREGGAGRGAGQPVLAVRIGHADAGLAADVAERVVGIALGSVRPGGAGQESHVQVGGLVVVAVGLARCRVLQVGDAGQRFQVVPGVALRIQGVAALGGLGGLQLREGLADGEVGRRDCDVARVVGHLLRLAERRVVRIGRIGCRLRAAAGRQRDAAKGAVGEVAHAEQVATGVGRRDDPAERIVGRAIDVLVAGDGHGAGLGLAVGGVAIAVGEGAGGASAHRDAGEVAQAVGIGRVIVGVGGRPRAAGVGHAALEQPAHRVVRGEIGPVACAIGYARQGAGGVVAPGRGTGVAVLEGAPAAYGVVSNGGRADQGRGADGGNLAERITHVGARGAVRRHLLLQQATASEVGDFGLRIGRVVGRGAGDLAATVGVVDLDLHARGIGGEGRPVVDVVLDVRRGGRIADEVGGGCAADPTLGIEAGVAGDGRRLAVLQPRALGAVDPVEAVVVLPVPVPGRGIVVAPVRALACFQVIGASRSDPGRGDELGGGAVVVRPVDGDRPTESVEGLGGEVAVGVLGRQQHAETGVVDCAGGQLVGRGAPFELGRGDGGAEAVVGRIVGVGRGLACRVGRAEDVAVGIEGEAVREEDAVGVVVMRLRRRIHVGVVAGLGPAQVDAGVPGDGVRIARCNERLAARQRAADLRLLLIAVAACRAVVQIARADIDVVIAAAAVTEFGGEGDVAVGVVGVVGLQRVVRGAAGVLGEGFIAAQRLMHAKSLQGRRGDIGVGENAAGEQVAVTVEGLARGHQPGEGVALVVGRIRRALAGDIGHGDAGKAQPAIAQCIHQAAGINVGVAVRVAASVAIGVGGDDDHRAIDIAGRIGRRASRCIQAAAQRGVLDGGAAGETVGDRLQQVREGTLGELDAK
ncbi:hypothetical protein D9M68_440400 [compost metagenome]